MVGLILRYKESAMLKNDTIHVSIMSFLCTYKTVFRIFVVEFIFIVYLKNRPTRVPLTITSSGKMFRVNQATVFRLPALAIRVGVQMIEI